MASAPRPPVRVGGPTLRATPARQASDRRHLCRLLSNIILPALRRVLYGACGRKGGGPRPYHCRTAAGVTTLRRSVPARSQDLQSLLRCHMLAFGAIGGVRIEDPLRPHEDGRDR
jgi:hypothetical protein